MILQMLISTSLTKILVSGNKLGDKGTTILCDAIRESTVSKVVELDLARNGIGPDGAKAIAALCAVCPSLTVADLRYTALDTKTATTLATVAKEKGISLCGIKPEQTEANLQGSYPRFMKPADAILLTADLAVRGSLTSLPLGDNHLGDEGVEALSIGLKDSKSLATLDLSNRHSWSTKFGPKGATALASAIAVMLRLSPSCPR